MSAGGATGLDRPVYLSIAPDVIFAVPGETVAILMGRMTDRRTRHLSVLKDERKVGDDLHRGCRDMPDPGRDTGGRESGDLYRGRSSRAIERKSARIFVRHENAACGRTEASVYRPLARRRAGHQGRGDASRHGPGGNEEIKNSLLSQKAPHSLRAPIESSETIKKVSLWLSSRRFFALPKPGFNGSQNG